MGTAQQFLALWGLFTVMLLVITCLWRRAEGNKKDRDVEREAYWCQFPAGRDEPGTPRPNKRVLIYFYPSRPGWTGLEWRQVGCVIRTRWRA